MSGSHEMIVERGGSVAFRKVFDVDEVRVGDRGRRSRCPKEN